MTCITELAGGGWKSASAETLKNMPKRRVCAPVQGGRAPNLTAKRKEVGVPKRGQGCQRQIFHFHILQVDASEVKPTGQA